MKEDGSAQTEAAEIHVSLNIINKYNQYALFSVIDRTGVFDTVFNV